MPNFPNTYSITKRIEKNTLNPTKLTSNDYINFIHSQSQTMHPFTVQIFSTHTSSTLSIITCYKYF